MKKSIHRPQTVAVADLDLAVKAALVRVAQSQELSDQECQEISGGLFSPELDPFGPTIGMVPPEPPIFGSTEPL